VQIELRRCRNIRKIAMLGGILLAVAACKNPFSTREPEPPTGTGSRWIPPFTAEIVLENLRNAIADRNVENYLRCLSDSLRSSSQFRFVPEPAVANTNPGVFVGWGIGQEERYFSQLRDALPPDSARSLRLDSLQTITFSDSAIFLSSYDLQVRHLRQNIGDPGRVRGELRFWLIKDQLSGEWSINRWADFATGPSQTWSALKAAFVRLGKAGP
jgi:hypothetical protein